MDPATADTITERLLAAIPAGVYQLDADGRVIRANSAARRFLGLRFDANGALAASATPLDERGAQVDPLALPPGMCLASGDTQPGATVGYRDAHGHVVWTLCSAEPMRDDAGGLGALVTLVDISARKAIEADRLALQARLARADRLANVGTLATGVAHEINNPLSFVIQNLAEAAGLLRPDDAAGSALAARIHEALDGARRIRHIVRDLSSFAADEVKASAPISMNAALEAAVRMARHEIRHRAQLRRDLGTLPLVEADPGRLSQVFLNLLLRAARSIPEGDIEGNEVSIRSWEAGGQVLVEVRDSGVGLEPDALRDAFEPFGEHESGLGLGICHDAVAEVGGRIELSSGPEGGTRVLVSFPKAEGEGRFAALHTPAPFRVSLPPEAAPGGLPRALVVDDQQPVRRALARMLARHFLVDQAASVGELRECVALHPRYDLVLCDMMLLDGSGVEVQGWLSRHHPALAERLIFMTGGVFTPAARAFLDSGAHPWVEKPFRVADVLSIYHRLAQSAPHPA